MLEGTLRRLLRVGSTRQIPIVLRTAASRIVPGVRAGKIFAIGFNKTGTSSLHRIFEELGYISYHGVAWRDTDRMSIFYKFDAFSDDIPKDFRKLDRVFSGSKFILQVRALDAWIDSRIEHIRRANARRAERGEPLKPFPDAAMIADWTLHRERHHRAVLAYFANRPNDLLVVNFIEDADAAAKIAQFLGHDRAMPKPHANRGSNSTERLAHGALIAEALSAMGVPRAAWSADLLCLPAEDGLSGVGSAPLRAADLAGPPQS